jgi:3'-5' exoribonuclease
MRPTQEFTENDAELQRLIDAMDAFGEIDSPAASGLSKQSFEKVLDAQRSVFIRFVMEHLRDAAPRLQPMVELVVSRLFMFHPASRGKHHNFVFGLNQHTAEVMKIGLAILESVSEIKGEVEPGEKEVFVTAALFHDLEKTSDYTVRYDHGVITANIAAGKRMIDAINESMSLTYSDFCDKVRHISAGAISFNVLMQGLGIQDPFPDFTSRVTHALLSHHQLPEWGSPVSPKTGAAWALHLADMASVNMVEQRHRRGQDAKNS